MAKKFTADIAANFLDSTMVETSGLAFIEVKNKTDPFILFKEWFEEAQQSKIFASAMNLATSSRDGKVSNRTVVMREIKDDGFIILTPEKGKKCQHIAENPNVALCFLWSYRKGASNINRQVRVEGVAEAITTEEVTKLFNSEPLFCKIRAHICDQGEPVEWEELKEKHDEILKKVQEGSYTLHTPKNYKGYKILPEYMEFYFGYDQNIADRIRFTKIPNETWKSERIAT